VVNFAWEWPLRWWRPLDDHDYATHVSSADLLRMTLGHARLFPLPAALGIESL